MFKIFFFTYKWIKRWIKEDIVDIFIIPYRKTVTVWIHSLFNSVEYLKKSKLLNQCVLKFLHYSVKYIKVIFELESWNLCCTTKEKKSCNHSIISKGYSEFKEKQFYINSFYLQLQTVWWHLNNIYKYTCIIRLQGYFDILKPTLWKEKNLCFLYQIELLQLESAIDLF